MIRSISVVTVLLAAVSISPLANAWPSLPSTPSVPSTGSGGATPEKLDAFMVNAKIADDLVREAAWHLGSAVLSKEKHEELKQKREAVNKLQDPKEKEAELKKLDESLNEQLAKVDYEKASEAEKTASEEHKKKTAAAIYNYALGVLKDAELVIEAKGLVSGVPSPTVATKVAAVSSTASSLASQASNQAKVVGGIKQMAGSVNLKELPTKASDKPMAMAD